MTATNICEGVHQNECFAEVAMNVVTMVTSVTLFVKIFQRLVEIRSLILSNLHTMGLTAPASVFLLQSIIKILDDISSNPLSNLLVEAFAEYL